MAATRLHLQMRRTPSLSRAVTCNSGARKTLVLGNHMRQLAKEMGMAPHPVQRHSSVIQHTCRYQNACWQEDAMCRYMMEAFILSCRTQTFGAAGVLSCKLSNLRSVPAFNKIFKCETQKLSNAACGIIASSEHKCCSEHRCSFDLCSRCAFIGKKKSVYVCPRTFFASIFSQSQKYLLAKVCVLNTSRRKTTDT